MDQLEKKQAYLSVAHNSIYIISAQVIGKFLTFLFYVIMARYLGDVGIGKYSFILSLVGMFAVLANFGLDNLLVRDIALNKNQAPLYLGNSMLIKSFFAIVSVFVIVSFIRFTPKSTDVMIGVYIYCFTLFTDCISASIESIFNAYEKLKYVAAIEILVNLIKLTIAGIIWLKQLNLLHLLVAISVLSGLRALIGFTLLRQKFFKVQFKLDLNLIKYLLKTAYPFALMGIISVIYFRIDTIMLSLMKGDLVVGWYAAAFNLLPVLMFVSYGFSQAIFPVLSRFYQSSQQTFLTIGEKSFNYLLILGLPIAVGIALLGDKIILLIYGEQFQNSIVALKILIWSIPLIYINSPLLRILYSANKQKLAMNVAFVSMLLNISLNFILIPRFSYIGASVATLVSESVNFLLYYIAVYKIFAYNMKLNGLAIKSLGGLSAMTVFIYLFKEFNLFFIIPFSIVIYFFVLYKIHAFSQNDLALVRSILQKG